MANTKNSIKFGFHKCSFGLCSVAIALFFLGSGVNVNADTLNSSQADNSTAVVSSDTNGDTSSDIVIAVPDNAPTAPEKPEYPIPIKDIPHNDIPKAEDSNTEESNMDITKTEEHKNDIITSTTPKTESPKSDTSKTESSKTESSKSERPKNESSDMSSVQPKHMLPKTGDNNSTLLTAIGVILGSLGLTRFLPKRKS